MLAVDTNIIVRYLVADDVSQTAKAKKLIESEDVFVPTTVLLETEWVLRHLYDLSRSSVLAALRAFVGLKNVKLEDQGKVRRTLDWMSAGLDFADASHLAAADRCEGFLTFDRAFVKAAKIIPSCEVRLP